MQQKLPSSSTICHAVFDDLKPDGKLQKECRKLCEEFPDVFKPELRKLKAFELEVKFKAETKPMFCKPRMVPFALQEDLAQAYNAGIKRGREGLHEQRNLNLPNPEIERSMLGGRCCGTVYCVD